jgi:hypothetical protein
MTTVIILISILIESLRLGVCLCHLWSDMIRYLQVYLGGVDVTAHHILFPSGLHCVYFLLCGHNKENGERAGVRDRK